MDVSRDMGLIRWRVGWVWWREEDEDREPMEVLRGKGGALVQATNLMRGRAHALVGDSMIM